MTNTDSLQVDYNGNVINPLNGRLQYSEAYYYNPYIEFVNAAGGKDIDYVINVREQTVIANGSTVINKGANSVVKGWSDNDSVINTNSASYAQIKTGDGNDTIINSGSKVTINGGGDDDVISLKGSEQLVEYADGDGNDTIYGYRSNDTINVFYGSIRIKKTAGNAITIKDADGSVTSKTYGTILEGSDEDSTLTSTIPGALFRPGDNDVVSLNGPKQIVEYSGGNSTVYGVDEDDMIRVDENMQVSINGSDVLMLGGGYDGETNDFEIDSILTLKNVVDKNIKVITHDGKARYVMPVSLTLDVDDPYEKVIDRLSNTSITGTAGADAIAINSNIKTLNNISVDGGSGDDKIEIGGGIDGEWWGKPVRNVTVNAGDSNNDVNFYDSSDVSVNAGDGNDYVESYGSSLIAIDAGAGNDKLDVSAEIATVNAGAGDDTITIGIYHGSINAGDGDDSIKLNSAEEAYNGRDTDSWNKFVTVNAGKGNDTLSASTEMRWLYQYADGDGNDVINYNEIGGLIQLTSGSVSNAALDGNDVILTVGNGKLTLKDFGRNPNAPIAVKNTTGEIDAWYVYDGALVKMDGNAFAYDGYDFRSAVSNTVLSADGTYEGIEGRLEVLRNYGDEGQIVNYGSNSTINAVADNEDNRVTSIYNYLNENVLINTNAEHVHNSGDNVTINGSGSDNKIYNEGANVIITQSGEASIENLGTDVTLNVGAGNDRITLRGSNQVVYYTEGDGNDTIYGAGSSDTIRIDGEFSTVESGDDLIIAVGDGSMTFKDGTGVGFRVVDAAFIPSADTTAAGILRR